MTQIGVVMTPDQTLAELDRLVDFNDHLLPFEPIDITASLLRRVHEGMHALLEIATEAHDEIRELQHQRAHATGGEHTHETEEVQQ